MFFHKKVNVLRLVIVDYKVNGMGEFVERKIGKNIISWLPLDDKILSRDDVYTSWCGSSFIFKQENVRFNIQRYALLRSVEYMQH